MRTIVRGILTGSLILSMCFTLFLTTGCEVHDHGHGHYDEVDVVDVHGYRHHGYYDEHHDWHGGYDDEHHEHHDDPHDWHN